MHLRQSNARDDLRAGRERGMGRERRPVERSLVCLERLGYCYSSALLPLIICITTSIPVLCLFPALPAAVCWLMQAAQQRR